MINKVTRGHPKGALNCLFHKDDERESIFRVHIEGFRDLSDEATRWLRALVIAPHALQQIERHNPAEEREQ